MTSAVKITSKLPYGGPGPRAGMTLLEVVIALSLVALIVGIGAVKYADGAEERALRTSAGKIEAMASRGHAMSILHQKPFWLRFEEGRVVLAGADVKAAPVEGDEPYIPDPEDFDESPSMETVYDEFQSEVFLSLRRWGSPEDAWIEPDEDTSVTWQFQSTGLCEPVGIRLVSGESWIEMHMHPLTARVESEEMMIK
jgi:prepilin-type N-terminal cleavage/methylation domain-containing protein